MERTGNIGKTYAEMKNVARTGKNNLFKEGTFLIVNRIEIGKIARADKIGKSNLPEKQHKKPIKDELTRITENIERNNAVRYNQTLRELQRKILLNQREMLNLQKEGAEIREIALMNRRRYNMRRERTQDLSYEGLLALEDRIGHVSKGMSEEEIERIGCEDIVGEEMCIVCLNWMEEGTSASKLQPCGHVYHKDCIRSWLLAHKTCPLCMGTVQV
jgi:hypothetical protein